MIEGFAQDSYEDDGAPSSPPNARFPPAVDAHKVAWMTFWRQAPIVDGGTKSAKEPIFIKDNRFLGMDRIVIQSTRSSFSGFS